MENENKGFEPTKIVTEKNFEEGILTPSEEKLRACYEELMTTVRDAVDKLELETGVKGVAFLAMWLRNHKDENPKGKFTPFGTNAPSQAIDIIPHLIELLKGDAFLSSLSSAVKGLAEFIMAIEEGDKTNQNSTSTTNEVEAK